MTELKDSWISVKDALPEDRTGVEVKTYADGITKSGFKDGRFEYNDLCEECSALVGGTPDYVTHWRKLKPAQ